MSTFGDGRQAALQKVSVPAIIMMVMAGLSILGGLINIVRGGIGVVSPAKVVVVQKGPGAGDFDFTALYAQAGAVNIVAGVFTLIFAGLILFGAMKMKNLQGYGLAMTAAILSMIPCNCPCCIISLPVGIWALVVLLDANVKSQFTP